MLSQLSRELHLWRLMHFSSNKLVRPCDRLESTFLVIATVLAAGSLTLGFMVGSETYANVNQVNQTALHEQQTRHSVTAVILESPKHSRDVVKATWTLPDGQAITGGIGSQSTDKPDARRTIWIDESGKPVDKPRTEGNAAAQAIAAGVVTGFAIVGLWAGVIFAVRTMGDRHRFKIWEAEWQSGAIDSHR